MTVISQIISTFTTILVLICMFSHGEAVICYQCNSAFDPRCGDPFDPYSLGTVNCSFQQRLEHLNNMEPTLCRKISQIVYGKRRVVRGCGYVTDTRDNAECIRRTGTHGVVAYYCSCTTDLCNAASGQMPTIGLLFGIVGFILAWTSY